jgi:hypothetical protein
VHLAYPEGSLTTFVRPWHTGVDTIANRCRLLSIEELLHGAEVKMLPQYGTFKEAQRARMGGEHPQLDF